jgi:hypothetical protein
MPLPKSSISFSMTSLRPSTTGHAVTDLANNPDVPLDAM